MTASTVAFWLAAWRVAPLTDRVLVVLGLLYLAWTVVAARFSFA